MTMPEIKVFAYLVTILVVLGVVFAASPHIAMAAYVVFACLVGAGVYLMGPSI